MPHRLLTGLTIAAAALCLATAAVGASSAAIKVARGSTLRIKTTTDSFAICIAVVNYANGDLQLGATKHAIDGRLTWSFPVERRRPLGRGTWYVRCGLPVIKTGTFVVVNPTSAG